MESSYIGKMRSAVCFPKLVIITSSRVSQALQLVRCLPSCYALDISRGSIQGGLE